MKETAQKIHNHLSGAGHVLVVAHPNPDEDTFGSALAMAEYLREMNREASIFCATPIGQKLRYLPNHPTIIHDTAAFQDPRVDTIVFVDCGDPRYAGVAEAVKNHPATIINIDHHNTNELYGHHNMVIKNASATAEIMFMFFEYNRLTISRHMATNLLAGIISDTGNFTNAATSPTALAIAGELVRRGANFKLINFFTQKDKTLDLLRLWGAALSRLTKNEEAGLVYTYLKKNDFEANDLKDSEGGEGLSDFMNTLDGAKITLILKEIEGGKVKGSFRTVHDDVDVSAMAKKFGGGGHKKAAGFTTEGPIETVIEKILTLNAQNDKMNK